MIKFDGRIVQFGFGAVGKSFYEKVSKEISFDENAYFVITKYKAEFIAYINLGGMVANFIACEVSKDNFRTVFGKYLKSGDLLLDFADTVGTKDICDWCAENNIMYLNTGDADWPEFWLNIFEQNKILNNIIKKHHDNYSTNKHPVVLQHGNNPGLVSHFVKAGIEYIVDTQLKKEKQLKALINQNKFNEAAYMLGIKMIHVNDIDLQLINNNGNTGTLFNTWCIDSFFFEMLSEATIIIGNHENIDFEDECKYVDFLHGFIEFKKLSAEKKCRTYYPNGVFEGFLVPHDETVTIAKSLEVKRDGKLIYRPSVMFVYSPCHLATEYLRKAKVNEYPKPNPAKPLDCDNVNGQTIIRGYIYPKLAEIVYQEKIASGTEYVGVLLMGEKFKPVWVGNRVEPSFLYRYPKSSYWQTPTITPVAMSALAAVCWMIKNKERRGIYFPDEIVDYKYVLKIAEKYISKTIYKTFEKGSLKKALKIDFSNLRAKDFFVQ
ncbi:MAG: saccharopine dehydrogenase NADP-binding domain-containing protein [Oscillospiraceae bacterium]|nr:saccharopine dehydrogenase NADP-binding domain-containing protein [Oscillospiraceae bacterium]